MEPGKRLCEQHFLKRCRTLLLRLSSEEQKQVPAAVLDTLVLQWKALDTGEMEGHISAKLPSLLSALKTMTYKLRPTA